MMTRSNQTPDDSGVRAGRARRRRLWAIVLVAVGVGAVLDAVLIPMIHPAPPGGAMLPPLLAVAGALTFALLINGGCWLFLQFADELEQRDNLIACTIAFHFNLSAFLAWFLLWTGGLVPSPDAFLLFIATFLVAGFAYGGLKLRRHFG